MAKGYIDKKGKILELLEGDLAANSVSLPSDAFDFRDAILAVLKKLAKGLSIKKHEEKKKRPTARRTR
ncbi:hypothetical protein [Vibrio sonorensis]|uniref:hypothetical protein n=1 Tax=Vibrio sonorensis TaxID=1004316 RepID=UPI001FDEC06F|nr:hypothetical protein [Vibrio sonorensis]